MSLILFHLDFDAKSGFASLNQIIKMTFIYTTCYKSSALMNFLRNPRLCHTQTIMSSLLWQLLIDFNLAKCLPNKRWTHSSHMNVRGNQPPLPPPKFKIIFT
jgi:hypothetical protein